MKKKKKKLFAGLSDRYRGEGAVPRCPHFGTCGGCMFQDIPYPNQLELKKDYINNLAPGLFQVDSVAASEPYGYRNRMDFVTAFGKFGLREAGSYRFVADLTTCPLMQEKSRGVFEKIRESVKEIEGYNYLSHKGYLRYVVFRQAYYTGEVMVNFVVADEEIRVMPVIEKIIDDVDSISILLNGGLADLSSGEEIETIKGGFIEEKFDGVRFRITPNSFFQSNSAVAKMMYSAIQRSARGKILDLYSGVGSISLYIADQAIEVTGIELAEESVRSAEMNRDINSSANVSFEAGDALDFLKEFGGAFDTVILDPPRSGLHPKVVGLVNNLKIDRLVYMSCNPATFANDLAGLTNFNLETIEAFDMFPQTPHVETLAVFNRR